MSDDRQPPRGWLWGPLLAAGPHRCLVTLLLDQAHKWWMLDVSDIADARPGRGHPVSRPCLREEHRHQLQPVDQESYAGQLMLAAFGVAATICASGSGLPAGVTNRCMAVCLGLIMGGALGNAIDRVILGGVADFFSLHAFGFYWYVFNMADVAIVAGVIGLLYDSFLAKSQRRRKVVVAQGIRHWCRHERECGRTGGRGMAMPPRSRPSRVSCWRSPLCLAFAAGGCGTDDIQFNGGLFDMVGLSDAAKAKTKSGDPKVAERAPLVVPPSLQRLPPPGERSSRRTSSSQTSRTPTSQEGIAGGAGAQAGRVLQGQLRQSHDARRRDDRARRRGAARVLPSVGAELHQEVEFERRRVAAEPISTSDGLCSQLRKVLRTKTFTLVSWQKIRLPCRGRPFIPAGGEGGGALLSTQGGNTNEDLEQAASA